MISNIGLVNVSVGFSCKKRGNFRGAYWLLQLLKLICDSNFSTIAEFV